MIFIPLESGEQVYYIHKRVESKNIVNEVFENNAVKLYVIMYIIMLYVGIQS